MIVLAENRIIFAMLEYNTRVYRIMGTKNASPLWLDRKIAATELNYLQDLFVMRREQSADE